MPTRCWFARSMLARDHGRAARPGSDPDIASSIRSPVATPQRKGWGPTPVRSRTERNGLRRRANQNKAPSYQIMTDPRDQSMLGPSANFGHQEGDSEHLSGHEIAVLICTYRRPEDVLRDC